VNSIALGERLGNALVVVGAVLALPFVIVGIAVRGILEFAFPGIIFRGVASEQGAEMVRLLREAVVSHQPIGVVVDLLGVRRGGGDELWDLPRALFDNGTGQPLRACVLAKKPVARMLRGIWDITFFHGRAGEIVFTEFSQGMKHLTAQPKDTA
jgi:hypothetical protein